MNNKINWLTISIFGVIGIFTIGFFLFASNASKVLATNSEHDLLDVKKSNIEKLAVIYAENNQDLFKDDKTQIHIKVEDLVKLGYVINDEALIKPENEIKLTKEDDKITAKVLI